MSDDEDKESPTPDELRKATVWRIVRAIYLRVIVKFTHRAPVELSDEEANEKLDPWLRYIEHDCMMLAEIADQAKFAGMSEAHGRLHAAHVHETEAHDLLDDLIVSTSTTPEDVHMMPNPFRQEK